MKAVLLIASLAICVALIWARPDEKYTTKYDNVNLDEILNNERLYKKYFECLIGKGNCTPDGKELKESLPDALATECSKCSEKQKAGSEKVFRFLLENKPDDFIQIEKLYDKDRVYRNKYKDVINKKGIKLPD